jgi:hypothetical protein
MPGSAAAAAAGAHHLGLHLVAGAGGVGADQAELQLATPVGGDESRRQRPEPGGHPIVRVRVGSKAVDHGACGDHPITGVVGDLDLHEVAGNGDDVRGRERGRADDDG